MSFLSSCFGIELYTTYYRILKIKEIIEQGNICCLNQWQGSFATNINRQRKSIDTKASSISLQWMEVNFSSKQTETVIHNAGFLILKTRQHSPQEVLQQSILSGHHLESLASEGGMSIERAICGFPHRTPPPSLPR